MSNSGVGFTEVIWCDRGAGSRKSFGAQLPVPLTWLGELGPWSCFALFLFGFLSIVKESPFSNLDADILKRNFKMH